MKRILLLPLFAMAVFVSQAQAQDCTSDGGTVTYLCAWGGEETTNCYKLAPEGGKNCTQRASDCGAGLRSKATVDMGSFSPPNCSGYTVVSSTPTFDATPELGEGECKNGGTKQVFCQQTWGCFALDTRYSSIGSPATCSPTTTPCECPALIANCPAGGLYTDVNKATLPNDGAGATVKCSDYNGIPVGGGTSSSSGGDGSSGGGFEPIISYNSATVTGLNVVHFARSLKIASGKDATVSLFDMHGKQVFSKKVFSGITTISLEKQRQGVYYAVVKSDSQKQTVKVILK